MKTMNHLMLQFSLGLACVALGAGCGKGSTAKVDDTPTQEKANATTKQQPAGVQEAIKLAVKCAGEHWIIQESGALWFGHVDQSFFGNDCDVQFKPVTHNLVADEISEADRLNGVEWHGTVNFVASAYRTQFPSQQSWQDWEPWKLGTFWSVKLEKRNGQWTVDEQAILLSRGRSGQVQIGFYSVRSRKPTTAQKS